MISDTRCADTRICAVCGGVEFWDNVLHIWECNQCGRVINQAGVVLISAKGERRAAHVQN